MEGQNLTQVDLREIIRTQQESSESSLNKFSSKTIIGEYSFSMQVILKEENSSLNQRIKLRMEEAVVSETQKVYKLELYSQEDLFFRFAFLYKNNNKN